ncbi:hypothetical protein B0H14DRAFT_2612951 [Mycena olivaceomarginata]|nr:hypothetical protein B0H14DRAFT_2612951 [Mycena olivaceomarginata]
MAFRLPPPRASLRPLLSHSFTPFRSQFGFISTQTKPATTWVPPETPTTLGDQKSLAFPDGNELFLQLKAIQIYILRLRGNNLFIMKVVACYVLPEELNISKFKSALARTLARFPTYAGKLNRTDDDWRIDLTNSPIPVEVVEDDETSQVVPPSVEHCVVQPSLAQFLNPVSLEGAMKGEDVPLTSFKITNLKQSSRTVIGHSWNHVLDLSKHCPNTTRAFHRRLRQHSINAAGHNPPSGAGREALYKKYTPHIVMDYPFEEVLAKYSKEAQHSPMIDINFTAKQLNAIHSLARRWQPDDEWCDGEAINVSRQDSMSAYLVTLQNRCLPKPLHTLMNMYRTKVPQEDALWRHPDNAGNCVYLPSVDLSTAHDLGSISRAIRRNLIAARSKEFLETYLMLNSESQNHIVNMVASIYSPVLLLP